MPDSTTTPNANTRSAGATKPGPPGIDPRGPRFGAGVTAVLLIITLLLGTGTTATALLGVVGLLFLLGVTRGVQGTLQGLAFKAWVRPRLAPPAELEDPRPPRFAQLVGLLFAALGFPAAVPIAAAVALVAAFLNSVFGLCLGCELYLLGRRLTHQS